MEERKEITIVTHSSGFHTDDVFAVATLLLFLKYNEKVKVIRSRDKSIIEKGDYVVDVGDIYNPEINRFDHHQKGGAGLRKNSIPYAAFGLVWKRFGEELSGSSEVALKIDSTFIQALDASDNGVPTQLTKIPGVYSYDVGSLVSLFGPTWKESDTNIDDIFMKLVSYAKVILARLIVSTRDEVEAEKLVVEAYNNSRDKRLITVNADYPWEGVLSHFPEPLYVIYENRDKNWSIKAIRPDPFSYEPRKLLPEDWAGKRDTELEKVTGILGSIFAHNARFMAVAKTKEAVLKLAEIALKE
jgi:uncharacterized UPF0160 family protein